MGALVGAAVPFCWGAAVVTVPGAGAGTAFGSRGLPFAMRPCEVDVQHENQCKIAQIPGLRPVFFYFSAEGFRLTNFKFEGVESRRNIVSRSQGM